MPPGFTRSLAQRLNDLSPLQVSEAAEGDHYEPGKVLIAPGGFHMLVAQDDRITLESGPPLHGVRPAVDITLRSVTRQHGAATIGVILTGMGYDGARAMLELQKAGGRTIAEHQSTCVVYGMPRAVVELGAAGVVAPLPEISARIIEAVKA
jgi:two-component system chemotaxis response regulator CheB